MFKLALRLGIIIIDTAMAMRRLTSVFVLYSLFGGSSLSRCHMHWSLERVPELALIWLAPLDHILGSSCPRGH